jgi:DNA-binding GntR family transcriptional regulator
MLALANHLGVSPMTVQAALRILKDESLVYGVPGRGTFVADRYLE